MEVGSKSKMLKSLKIITLFLLILATTASSQNTTRCPFQYYYQFGDGFSDTGNSIRILPDGPNLPAARLPYGTTFPGTPTGRWSDGRVDADYGAEAVGLPNIRPYLPRGCNSSSAHDDNEGIVFAVSSSTFLDRPFFIRRNIPITSYATPLPYQIKWFRKYLKSVPSNPTDRVSNSLILLVSPYSNDIGYALVQGKSIHQVYTYIPFIIRAQIRAARKLIEMGTRRIVISGDVPLGCFPRILTALPSTDPLAYDALGCLKSVNSLIIYKNNALQQAINNLKAEFPNVTILYIDDYLIGITIITQMIASGGANIGLRSCCGIGGNYNYNMSMPCGSPGVPVCANPNEYIFWDGEHYTQEMYRRIAEVVVPPALQTLNCTL